MVTAATSDLVFLGCDTARAHMGDLEQFRIKMSRWIAVEPLPIDHSKWSLEFSNT
jgi:hypothetical protein